MFPRFCLAFLVSFTAALAQNDYVKTIESWRSERVARLTATDSWLTLIGRHQLQTGENSVGTAEDNSIRLAAGPPYLGNVTLEEGRVFFKAAPNALVQIDGTARRGLSELIYKGDQPSRVTFGSANFYVMDRGGALFLRVRDVEAANLKHFAGIDYFPIDPAWRIEAQWVPFEKSRMIPITNVLGQTSPAPVPGKAVFSLNGKTFELLPIDEGGDELFFVLTDLTAGEDTYEASRFLYAPKPKPGETTVTLDFNRAENPPCAFTEFATCPLPPKENRMSIRVTAGERKYRGKH